MTISVGVDCGNRMGVAVLADDGRLVASQAFTSKEIQSGALRDLLLPTLADRMQEAKATVWIERPDDRVMVGRATVFGIRHNTNVVAIFKLGMAAGMVAQVCIETKVPYNIITAGEVKELVFGKPNASKDEVALYLEALGYELPTTRRGGVDYEQSDAIAIALAGLRKSNDNRT